MPNCRGNALTQATGLSGANKLHSSLPSITSSRRSNKPIYHIMSMQQAGGGKHIHLHLHLPIIMITFWLSTSMACTL